MKLWHETSGEGMPLLLIHGWGMNASVWDPLMQRLNTVYQVTRVDLPGHGNSQITQHPDSLAAWSDALLEIAPENAIWLGWSLGGLLALQAALQAQKPMRAIYLMTATPCFAQHNDWPCAMPLATLQQFADNLEQDAQATLMRFLSLQIKGTENARELLKQLRAGFSARPSARHPALKAGLGFLKETDLRSGFKALQIPVHCTFGERDTLVPACLADQIDSGSANLTVQVINKAGHVPFLSHTDECLKSLQQLAERSSA